MPIELEPIPAPHAELVNFIADHPDKPLVDIISPYRRYESQLRTVFAQDRQDPRLNDPYVNVLPLFTENTKRITTRARNLAEESEEEKDRYIMALPDDKRRAHGSPATVSSLKDFQKNFGIFSENSLADMDWNNVVAAGSSVVNCLLPVPPEFNTTKRKLREYYHERFCPASDVDLFLYGLNEEEALEKIKQIEQAVRDAILTEVTVVRTKYAVTIASQYPTRHIQVVLRSYKSISEILTGFDIDAAGGAYDGNQVYVTPRALGSFISQINHIDLSRRSPSYENRLSKYSHRNFEVYWPELDRSKIDPTIFERSFGRTLGLARLLVLERLPTSSSRETYLNKRREERGRPALFYTRMRLRGNIKDNHEDEVADWVDETDVSNYHTFTVPYGQHFHAKKIEKLCYTRDLLLNAEWNQHKNREVYLHRHPAFFGRVQDVIEDCCGTCPKPVTPEEIEIAKKESEIYISGRIKLLIDDPGRQQIGSFNPLTEDDWTDMAYVGNTARLCQSIVDSDLDEVLAWLSQPGADVNRRDYTGRTPLHLAVASSSPEIVKCLVDHGARLTARLADGKTALHLAAERGIPDMIKTLMEKSIENEEADAEKQDAKRKALRDEGKEDKKEPAKPAKPESESDESSEEEEDSEEDLDMLEDAASDDDGAHSFATGSFVNVKNDAEVDHIKQLEEGNDDEPDFYKIDVLAWDSPCSPLHLAIAHGHEEVVKALCDYGGDALLPIKFLNSEREPVGAILTLALALSLPLEKAKSMAKLLLSLGATSSQADLNGCTVFHRYVESGEKEMIDTLWDNDKTGVKTSINHLVVGSSYWNPSSIAPLHLAIANGDSTFVLRLLEAGANPQIDFETWLKAAKFSSTLEKRLGNFEANKALFEGGTTQPLIAALQHCTDPETAIHLLERGADPNALPTTTRNIIKNEWNRRYTKGESALDIVRSYIKGLREYKPPILDGKKPTLTPGIDEYLDNFMEGTYQHCVVSARARFTKETYQKAVKAYERDNCKVHSSKKRELYAQRQQAVQEAIAGYEKLEKVLIEKGGKTFEELYPEIVKEHPGLYVPPVVSTTTQTTEEKPFSYEFRFSNVNDVTEARKVAYIQLFEAAWRGDLEKIKSLTMQSWDEEQTEPPLKISVTDAVSNSPFSLAFLFGHYDVAWGIAEIAHAQYAPDDEEKRYELKNDEEEGYSDDDSGASSDDGDEPRIVSKAVDKKFTIENIGQISMQVKSKTKALDMINWVVNTFVLTDGQLVHESANYANETLLDYLLKKCTDESVFKRYIDLIIHFGRKNFDKSKSDEGGYSFPEDVFQKLVEKGKVGALAEVIRKTGAGIPLDHLVKRTGVEVKEKPRFYQGLSVYGKKRKDWANAGRNMYVKPIGLQSPPLLYAALGGNLESVEWFLTETPLRLYTEFSQSKAAQEDSRFKHLTTTGGFEGLVSKWLGNQNELVLYCAILAPETEQGLKLVKYLIKGCPTALEAKDSDNNTPLLAAALQGHVEYCKLLIRGGADQSVRNKSGDNIIHCALKRGPKASQLKPLLEALDKGLLEHLLKQRCTLEQGGHTPLHAYINELTTEEYRWQPSPKNHSAKQGTEVVRLLLHYSKGAELELLSASGDSCLHTAVLRSFSWLTGLLLSVRPKLLYRENAVGRTPGEMARDKIMAKILKQPAQLQVSNSNRTGAWVAETIAQKAEQKEKTKTSEPDMDKVWEICSAVAAKYPDKRRIVSLNEASDVAKRLGEAHTSSRYFTIAPKAEEDEEDEAEDENKEENKAEVTQTGFVTAQANQRVNSSWKSPDEEKRLQEKKEANRGAPCEGCGQWHEEPASSDEEGSSEDDDEDSEDEDDY